MSPVVSKHAKGPVKLGCSLALGGVNANVRCSMSLASVVTKRYFSSQLNTTETKRNFSLNTVETGTLRTPGFPASLAGHIPNKQDTTVGGFPANENAAFRAAMNESVLSENQFAAPEANDVLAGKGTVMGFGPPKAPCLLRNRPYVPCSSDVNFPEQVLLL